MGQIRPVYKKHVLALLSMVLLSSGCGSSSNKSTAPDTTPPSIPTYLTAVRATDTRVSLRWLASTDNVGVTAYAINRNGSKLATTATATTFYSDTTCTANTGYTYAVAALDAAGNESAFSSSATTTTLPTGLADQGIPSAPTGLTASSLNSSSTITLSWSASVSNDVSGYNVYRATSQAGPFTIIVGVTTTTSYVDIGLAMNTTYYYEVTAFSGYPEESLNSNEASATTN